MEYVFGVYCPKCDDKFNLKQVVRGEECKFFCKSCKTWFQATLQVSVLAPTQQEPIREGVIAGPAEDLLM